MLGSFMDLATSASAAKCITASILFCVKTASSCWRFPRSTLQKVAPGGTAAECPSDKLSSAITVIPRKSKTSAQILPIYPDAPVTRMFEGLCSCGGKQKAKRRGRDTLEGCWE